MPMNSPATRNLDALMISEANEAIRFARGSFLKGVSFDVEIGGSRQTGVSFDPDSGKSFLSIHLEDPLASRLMPTVKSWRDAWILILAHESGHLRLNSICQANGHDPDEPDAQLIAMGIDQNNWSSAMTDSQKESAIESFCDICLAQTAIKFLGDRWRAPVEALRDQRAKTSRELGFLKSDEYATAPALDAFLDCDGKMEPRVGATIALDVLLLNTSGLKKAAIASAIALAGLKDGLREKIKRWRGGRPSSERNPQRPP